MLNRNQDQTGAATKPQTIVDELYNSIGYFWKRLCEKRPACFKIAKINFTRYCSAKWAHNKERDNFIFTIQMLNEDNKLTPLMNDVLADSITIRAILKNEYVDDMDALLNALTPTQNFPTFPGIVLKTGWGLAVNKNVDRKEESLEEMAERGDPIAEFNLSLKYSNGIHLTPDLKVTAYWLQRSAKQGYAKAQYNLAVCYDEGHGVEIDLQAAAYWYTLAASQGHIDAQNNLAIMLSTGVEGVPKDMKAAAFWYKCAAEQGDADCQYLYAHCLLNGNGVEQDLPLAQTWCERSIAAGCAKSVELLEQINEALRMQRPRI